MYIISAAIFKQQMNTHNCPLNAPKYLANSEKNFEIKLNALNGIK